MKMPFLLKAVLLSATFLPLVSYAQDDAAASVDNVTGKANVYIPFFTVTTGRLQLPLGVAYNGNGVKVRDIAGPVGLNWSLVAGGEVSRELRGVPDDQSASQAPIGWLYNTNGTKINNFNITNDNSSANCTDETADLSYLNTNFPDLSDTEPDIFHVNAPGLSCNLIFDKDHNLKVFPYQDIKASYTVNEYGIINSFTLTNDQGIKYYFGQTERSIEYAIGSTPPSYFKRHFDQFSGGVTYISSWKLTSITGLDGTSIQLSYLVGLTKTISTPLYLSAGGSSSPVLQYTKKITTEYQSLSYIRSFSDDDAPKGTVTFEYTDKILWRITGLGKMVLIGCDSISPNNTPVRYKRGFLTGFTIKGLDTVVYRPNGTLQSNYKTSQRYSLEYAGLSGTQVAIPDSSSKEVDYWGYYNASGATSLIPQVYINPANAGKERYRNIAPGAPATDYPYLYTGANRATNSATVANGALTKLTYMDGGSIAIAYEPNDFYDPTAGTVIQGGGIRVKQITTYDGLTTANNMVRNYSYLNPATGLSSGKPITLPVFAFTTPYSGSGTTQVKWQNSTVRSESDLSSGDNSIIYSHVRVSQPGLGSVLYQYTAPATNWDASTAPDWAPTVINAARIGCGTATFVTNDKNTYPFPYNPNFGFERGLLQKSSAFNNSGQVISQDSMIYQRSFATPVIILGLNFDNNTSAVKSYAKTSVITGTSKLISQVISKQFDQGSTTLAQTKTMTYNYGSANHKLPTDIQTTNSAGTTIKNNFKYIKDYTASATADSANTAIYNLALLNCNYLAENYTQVINSGVTKTTGASLTKFKVYSPATYTNFYLPWQSLKFVSASGVTDFAPSTITSGAFAADSRYQLIQNNLLYDENGSLESYTDKSRMVKTVIRSQQGQLPVLNVINARADEIAFSDFESDSLVAVNFVTDTIKNATPYTGFYSKRMTTTTELNKALKKSSLTNNYVFSVHIKSPVTGSVSGNMTVSLTGGTSSSKTIAYTTQPNRWMYYEVRIPVTGLSSNITAKVTSNNNILIDDALLYPENAQVSSMAYDSLTSRTMSATNTNGLTAYYSYDRKGRQRVVLDDDRNMVSKRTYVIGSSYSYFTTPVITFPSITNYNNVAFFADSTGWEQIHGEISTDGMIYTWNFGDGKPAVVSGDIYGLVSHRYAAPGTYTISVTKSSPIYGSKSATRTITIVNGSSVPVNVQISNFQNATINQVRFSQGGVLKYIYNPSSPITVPQGVYDVQIYYTGTFYNHSTFTGFTSLSCDITPVVRYSGDDTPITARCGAWQAGGNMTLNSVDLNGIETATFSLQPQSCPGGIE